MTTAERPEPLDAFRDDRTYLGADHRRNERRTWIVTGICAATLAALVAGGAATRSMALMASGLHMAAHVAALLVAAVDYHGALPIAAGGLLVNLVCIWLLKPTGVSASRNDPQGDLNLSAAHLHLSADAAVSVLALLAIGAGQGLGPGVARPPAGPPGGLP